MTVEKGGAVVSFTKLRVPAIYNTIPDKLSNQNRHDYYDLSNLMCEYKMVVHLVASYSTNQHQYKGPWVFSTKHHAQVGNYHLETTYSKLRKSYICKR